MNLKLPNYYHIRILSNVCKVKKFIYFFANGNRIYYGLEAFNGFPGYFQRLTLFSYDILTNFIYGDMLQTINNMSMTAAQRRTFTGMSKSFVRI